MKPYILFIFLLSTFDCFSQSKVDMFLTKLSETSLQEKVHIIYNKESYYSGDTIWLKAFIFYGYQATNLSSNLNVEIFNSKKQRIFKCKYPIINGEAESSIILNDALPEGVYFIRAYTNLMLNYDSTFQYLKPILVQKIGTKYLFDYVDTTWSIFARPEGGVLLNNIESKVAVRLFSNTDSISNWSGYLISDESPSDHILDFKNIDPNVATFLFTPQFGIQYKVIVESGINGSKSFILPKVERVGAVISVSQTDTLLDYEVRFKNLSNGSKFSLVGTIQNELIYRKNFEKKDSSFFQTISTKNLPKGVLHFTLFDEDASILSDRLVFLQPNPISISNLDSVNFKYNLNGSSSLELKIDSGYSYNVILYPNSKKINDYIGNVWLSLDFEHPIYNSNDFILNPTNINSNILDLIMISETWQRFNWTKISIKNSSNHHKDNNFLSYSIIVNYKNKPLVNEVVNSLIFLPDSSRQLIQNVTDSSGSFNISGLLFEGEAKLICELKNKKIDKNYITFIYNKIEDDTCNFPLQFSKEKYSYHKVEKSSIKILQDLKYSNNKPFNLKEVVVTSKLKTPSQNLIAKYVSGRYSYPRERYIDLINEEPESPDENVYDWITMRAMLDPKKTILFVNEFNSDAEGLRNINIKDVALIRVAGQLNRNYVFVYLKTGGDFAFGSNTKKTNTIQGYLKSIPFLPHNYEFDSLNNKILFLGNQLNYNLYGKSTTINYHDKNSNTSTIPVILGTQDTGEPFIKIFKF